MAAMAFRAAPKMPPDARILRQRAQEEKTNALKTFIKVRLLALSETEEPRLKVF